METNTYKLKLQKIKGGWTSYFFVAGIGLLFVNPKLSIPVILVGLAFSLKFKNDEDNKSAMFYNYALTLYNKGEFEKAKLALNNSIHYRTDNKDAYFFLGCLHFDEKDYRNALTNLKKGGVEDIADPSLVYVLGKCYYHVGEYEEAVKYLTMISYEGNHDLERERLITLGYSACETEEYDIAYECLEKTSMDLDEMKSEELEYAYYKGISAYNTDNDEEGKALLLKVYEKDKYYKLIDVYAREIPLI